MLSNAGIAKFYYPINNGAHTGIVKHLTMCSLVRIILCLQFTKNVSESKLELGAKKGVFWALGLELRVILGVLMSRTERKPNYARLSSAQKYIQWGLARARSLSSFKY